MELLEQAVAAEQGLIWRDDPLRYPYLRQSVRPSTSRTRSIGRLDPRSTRGIWVVGYGLALPDAGRQPRYWARRVFWCKLADRDGSRWPPAQEAVDPRLIRPRELTPWLFDDPRNEMGRVDWLRVRRAELGLADGQAVSSGP